MTRRKFIIQLKQVFQCSQEAAIQYLTQEIKFLLSHLNKRPKPTPEEKALLARAAKAVDPIYLEKTFNLFTPATMHRWYRELVRKKWNYSHLRKKAGRPKIDPELEAWIIKLAEESRFDGYETLVGRLKILGFQTNTETVQNVLKRNGIQPSPDRNRDLSWKEFLEAHWDSLVATDFLTWEVLTPFGLVTHSILFFIRRKDRKVHFAGLGTQTQMDWMSQIARNLTDSETGFLKPGMKLIHDRDPRFSDHFTNILNESGVFTHKLPARSPNLNAYAERFVRTLKEQCLSKLIITSEDQLRKAVSEFVVFYNHERAHQGIGNVIPLPRSKDRIGSKEGKIVRNSRLGRLLNYYHRIETADATTVSA